MDPAGYYYLIKPERDPNDIIRALNEALQLEPNNYHFQSPTIMPNVEYGDFTFDGSINDALTENDKNVLMIVPSSSPSIPCAVLVYSYKPNTEDEMGTIYINFLASNKRQTFMCGGTGQSLIKIFIDAAEVITPRGKTIQVKLYDAAKNKGFYNFTMSPKDANGHRTYNTGYKGKYTDTGIPLTRQASGPHSIIYDVHEFDKGNPASLIRDVLAFPVNVSRYPTERARESQSRPRSRSRSRSKSPSTWNHPSQRTGNNMIVEHIVSRTPFKNNNDLRSQAELNEKLIEDHAVHNYSESVKFLHDNFIQRVRAVIMKNFECEDEHEIDAFNKTFIRIYGIDAKGITKRKTKKRRNPRKRITYNLKHRH